MSVQLQLFQSLSGLSTLSSITFRMPEAEVPLTSAAEIHYCSKTGPRTPG